MVNRRGVVAAVLGLLYPGLGHLYLRKWVRALSWFALALAIAALVVPTSAYEAFETRGFQGLVDASESFGIEVTLSLLVVRILNAADGYIVAVREAAEDAATSAAKRVPTGDGTSTTEGGSTEGASAAENPAKCPNCGGELDAELDFCPWCTERLDDPSEEGDAA